MSNQDRNSRQHQGRQGQDRPRKDSIDAMLRKFNRKVKNDGKLQELRKREFYEKPSERKAREFRSAQRKTFLAQKEDEL